MRLNTCGACQPGVELRIVDADDGRVLGPGRARRDGLGTKAEGVDAIIAFIGSAIERWSATQHSISNIVVDGERCSCYFVAVHVKPEGGLFEVGGAYYDRLVHTDAGPRIAERVLEPIWER